MKGRTVTAEQKRFHDALAGLGCIACRKDGVINTHVSIHHIDGRTKLNAHWLVLPVCSSHHQDDGTKTAIHPYKARFEAQYGDQYELLRYCLTLLVKRDAVSSEIIGKVRGILDNPLPKVLPR